ncbi:hypothetical protein BsWGS_27009 [Bradybaena similaris]
MASKMIGDRKRTRKSLTLNAKLEMIKLSEQGLSMTEIGRKLGLARNTVSTIVNRKEKVLKEVESATPLNTRVIRKRDSLIADMEKLLLVWIEDQCRGNVPLTQAIIQDKALSLFSDLKAAKGKEAVEDTFKASRGWFSRFKERSLLHNIKLLGEAASSDAAAAETYQSKISEIIHEGGYGEQQIFCVNETSLYWKKMPNGTFSAKEKSKCPFQASRDGFTLLLGANAAGDFKLKPMLIYHMKNPAVLQNYVKSSLPVYYKYNSKAQMTASLFSDWFTNYFKPAVENYCKENSIPFKVLLLANSDPAHPRALTDLYKEITVLFLPVDTTKLLQPMDRGIIARFKAFYLRSAFAKAVNALNRDGHEENRNITLRDIWEGFSILDGIKAVRDAWGEVTEITLKTAWKQLIPSMEEYEGFECPTQDVTAHIVEMAREVEFKVEPGDVEEFLISHEAIADNLLLEDQRMLSEDESQFDDSPTVPREMTTKELEEAVSWIEMGMVAFERIDPNFKRSSSVNAVLLNSISCYKDILRERKRKFTTQGSLLSSYDKLSSLPSTVTTSFEQDSLSASIQTPVRASSKPAKAKLMRITEESEDRNHFSLPSLE